MVERRSIAKLIVFGEIYSENVGDGIIFECLRDGMGARGFEVLPADISARNGYVEPDEDKAVSRVRGPRRVARYFVRRSLTLRRIITVGRWFLGGRSRYIKKFADQIRRCDGVVIGGGQILVDRQLYFPLTVSAILSMARKAEKPVAVFSCGVDRRQGLIARRIFSRLIREATFISVRDQSSAQALRLINNGFPINVHPDVGFLSGKDLSSQVAAGRTLGVNLMPYETVAVFADRVRGISRLEYVSYWRSLIQSAADRGWRVNILTNGDPLDATAANEIYQEFLRDHRVHFPERPRAPAMLIKQLSNVSVLIASRMHSGIVAYSLGKRVVPLAWDNKVSSVWRETGDSVKVVPFNDLFSAKTSVDRLLALALNAEIDGSDRLAHRDQLTSRVENSLDELAKSFSRASIGRTQQQSGFSRDNYRTA